MAETLQYPQLPTGTLLEPEAYALYRVHLDLCWECDPGASDLCRLGGKFHRQWRDAVAREGRG